MFRWTWRAAVPAALAALLTLAACGSPSGTASTPSPSPSPTPSPNVLAKSQTVAGQSIVILTDDKGMTLYLWKKDSSTTKVNCIGGCAAIWPPFVLPSGVTKPVGGTGVSGTLGTLTNPEGKGLQVTYNGWPLYYYVKDKAAGDTTGQGVAGNWFVVPPSQAQYT